MDKLMLIDKAIDARDKAYAPYSNFQVGAAVKMESGKIYLGNNIENAAFSLTCCAERVAIFKALSEGKKNFLQIAVVADGEETVSPCGACRQVMAEFFTEKTEIILSNLNHEYQTFTIDELLPHQFKLKK